MPYTEHKMPFIFYKHFDNLRILVSAMCKIIIS